MGKAVRHDIALRLFLQTVVADGGGGGERFLQITLFKDLAGLVGMVRPHPGQTIRLQLQTHRELVGLGLADALASRLNLLGNT